MEIISFNVRRLIIFIAIITLTGCLGKDHLKPRAGEFYFQVYDLLTGEVVPGVKVKLGGRELETDSRGNVTFGILEPGDYEINLTRPWYQERIYQFHYFGKKEPILIGLTPTDELKGIILFAWEREKNKDIYLLNLETRNAIRLTDDESPQTSPASKGGDKMVFQSKHFPQSGYDLFISDSTGRTNPDNWQMVYSSSEDDLNPSIDKEGSLMVFQSEGKTIFLKDLNNPEVVPRRIGKGQRPTIDGSGTRIAYINTTYDGLVVYQITNGATFTYRYLDYKMFNPCLTADGKRVAFEGYQDSDGPRYIYCLYLETETNGSENIAAGTFKQMTNHYGGNDRHEHPCWSEDGNYLFFTANIVSGTDIFAIKYQESIASGGMATWVLVGGGTDPKECPSWGWSKTVH